MGLTNPGGVLAALGDDVVIRRVERPRTRRSDDEVGRALPEVVMRQLLSPENLDLLQQPVRVDRDRRGRTRRRGRPAHRRVVHAGVLLPGLRRVRRQRRPAPGQSGAGARHAQGRQGRLPAADPRPGSGDHPRPAGPGQGRVPGHPRRAVDVVPAAAEEPRRHQPLSTAHLQRAMRDWATALPSLDGPDRDTAGRPVPFPRDRLFPYAFRHTFAQRHADAGTPVDTLKELLGHDTVRTTLGLLPGHRQTNPGRPGPAGTVADRRRRPPGPARPARSFPTPKRPGNRSGRSRCRSGSAPNRRT